MSEIRSVSVHLDADVASYVAKMRLAGAETEKAFSSSGRSIDATNSKLSTTESTLGQIDARVRSVDASMRRVSTSRFESDFTRATSKLDGFVGQLGLVPALALSAGSALIPLAAAGAGVVAGFAAPLAFAGGGLTLFGLLGGAAIKQTQKQFKDLDTLKKGVDSARFSLEQARRSAGQNALTSASVANAQDRLTLATNAYHRALQGISPQQRQFHNALDGLESDFGKFINGPAGKDLLAPFTQGLKVADDLLPHAGPIIDAVAGSLGSLLTELDHYAQSQGFDHFVHEVADQIGPDLTEFGHILGDITPGVGQLLVVLGKRLSPELMHDLVRLSAQFDHWATSRGARKDVESFIQYFHQVGPEAASTIAAVARGLGHVVTALAPLGPPTLHIVQGIADAFSSIPTGTLTSLGTVAAQLIVFQKLGGFKALSFASSKGLIGGNLLGSNLLSSGSTKGALGGVLAEAGVQKVYVVNLPAGGLGGVGAPAASGGKVALTAEEAAAAAAAARVGAKFGLADILGGALSPAAWITAADSGNETNPQHRTPIYLTPAQMQSSADRQFLKDFGRNKDGVGGAVIPTKAALAPYGISRNDARSLLGIPDLKSTSTAFDALRQHAQQASQTIDQIGPHAHASLTSAIGDVTHFNGVLGSIQDKRIQVIVDTAGAIHSLEKLQAWRISNKTFTVTARYQRLEQAVGPGGGIGRHADGGTIGGAPRMPYGDKVLIAAAPGEEVISNRHGQADAFRADRAAGRIPAYAGGGTVAGAETHVTRTPAGLTMTDPALTRQANDVTLRLHGLSKSLAASQKVLDAERQTRQNLVSAERQLASSVTSALRGDIFASTGSVWDPSGGIDPLGQLHTEVTGDREFDRLLHQLHRRGVRGGALSALAQTGSVTDAQVVAAYSNRQLHQLTNRFRTEQQLSHQVGQFAGQAQYGAQAERATAAQELTAKRVHELQHQVNGLHKDLAKISHQNAQETGQATAKAINNATGQATRRVNRMSGIPRR